MKKTPRQYAIALYEAAKDAEGKELEEIILNFVKILHRENKLSWKDKIIAALKKYALQQEGIEEFEISSARHLSASLLNKIKKLLKTDKKIILKENLNPALLGGLLIKSESEIWDFSLKKQLQLLKNKLIT